MPALLRLLATHALIGFIAATLVVWALLAFDFGGLRTLAGQSGSGRLAIGLLTLFMGLTFASVHMGIAVMMSGRDDDDDGPGGGRRLRLPPPDGAPAPVPVPVRATARPRRGRR